MPTTLKPLSAVQLSQTEKQTLYWLKNQTWEESMGDNNFRVDIPATHHKVSVGKTSGYSDGPVVDLIKKLERVGVIGEQPPFPVKGHKAPFHLYMNGDDLQNMGINPQQQRTR